ncbi:MAG TPA: TMEM14 family protein [Polyangiales bacterium]|nr:TMEM14 family protein [Polyangiales bacterium]
MQSVLFTSLVCYGVLVLVGGTIGYVKAKSRASLIAGVVFASLLGVAAGLLATGSPVFAAALGLVSALALIARFLPAFLRTKKLMPAGAVVAVGAWVVIACVFSLANGA